MTNRIEAILHSIESVNCIDDLDLLMRKIRERKEKLYGIPGITVGKRVSYESSPTIRVYGTVVKLGASLIHVRVNTGVVWKIAPDRLRIENE